MRHLMAGLALDRKLGGLRWKEHYMEADEISRRHVTGCQGITDQAGSISAQVERMSPDTFLMGAAISVGASILLRIMGRQHDALFVGQWAPTLLLASLYAKGRREIGQGSGRDQDAATASPGEVH